MASILSISSVAFLIGDPARANMLFCLAASDVATAGDLANAANVAPSTASEHLAKLVDGGLITVTRTGRQRLYQLAFPEVAELLEGVENVALRVAPDGPPGLGQTPSFRHARPCGDHLAGRAGVALAEALLSEACVVQGRDGLAMTGKGIARLNDVGIDYDTLSAAPRRLLTLCHDWSEDAVHFGGAIGGALFQTFRNRDWLRHKRGSQLVEVTPTGRAALRQVFGVDLGA